MQWLSIGPLRTRAAGQGLRGHHDPPEVVWLEPELDDGADDPLLNPEPEELELDDPELEPNPELVPDEPVPDEPVPDEPVPALVDPELSVPEDDPADDEPDEVEPAEDVVLCEPGRASAIAPAVTTLASPTVAVAVWTRLCPRARDAMARRTLSRFGVFIPGSLLPASGNGLCTGSQPPMSLDGTDAGRAKRPSSAITHTVVNGLPAIGRPRPQGLYVRTVRRGLARAGPRAAGRDLAGPRPAAHSPGPAARTTNTSKITLVKGYGGGICCHHGWHD
jgi:hypothetical protein